MNHFEARADGLWCEGVPLRAIAEAVGTPVYVYSTATLRRHFRVFAEAFAPHAAAVGTPLVAFALKACPNLSVIRVLAQMGAGADTVSEGEIRRALAAGVPPERIVFSGVGKTDGELRFALRAGVAEINVESGVELDRLAAAARAEGVRPAVAIRVNPQVEAGGHAKITTGAAHNKFGVSLAEAEALYARGAALGELRMVGLACHIGSQITELAPLEAAFRKLRALAERLRARGLPVERLDLGGGLGVPYYNAPEPPAPAEYAAMVARVMGGVGASLAFEPGRVIAANAGVLLSTVVHVHERAEGGQRFLVLDAAMNDLLRPTLYDAYHEIRPLLPPRGEALAYDVVGPVCETGDTFTRDRLLPRLEAGEGVAFMSAGAYGASMSSEYNSRPLVPEVLVDGDRWAVVRPRPSYDDMLAREPVAPWLAPGPAGA